jgi:hypothetical protein
MPSPVPSERVLAARIAAHESWAATPDRSARTAAARQAFIEKFDRQADPDGVLEPAERTSRAESLRSAHYSRLALKAAQARRKSRELSDVAEQAEAELSELSGGAQ